MQDGGKRKRSDISHASSLPIKRKRNSKEKKYKIKRNK